MVEKWKAQEIVQYLEEQLSNSLLYDDLLKLMKMDTDVQSTISKKNILTRIDYGLLGLW